MPSPPKAAMPKPPPIIALLYRGSLHRVFYQVRCLRRSSCIFRTSGGVSETAKELVAISEKLKINTAKNFMYSYCIL